MRTRYPEDRPRHSNDARRPITAWSVAGLVGPADAETARGSFGTGSVLAWVAVGIPFSIGLYIAIEKAAAFFQCGCRKYVSAAIPGRAW